MAHWDWYQTDQLVVIDIFIKGANDCNVNVEFKSDTVIATVNGSNVLDIRLSADIAPEQSFWGSTPSKIEISLKKVETTRWNACHLTKVDNNNEQSTDNGHEQLHKDTRVVSKNEKQASEHVQIESKECPHVKDWDKIVEQQLSDDNRQEEKSNNEQLHGLFQQIYRDADNDTRRAMMKSFIESNGTALSTNWDQVSKDRFNPE